MAKPWIEREKNTTHASGQHEMSPLRNDPNYSQSWNEPVATVILWSETITEYSAWPDLPWSFRARALSLEAFLVTARTLKQSSLATARATEPPWAPVAPNTTINNGPFPILPCSGFIAYAFLPRFSLVKCAADLVVTTPLNFQLGVCPGIS